MMDLHELLADTSHHCPGLGLGASFDDLRPMATNQS